MSWRIEWLPEARDDLAALDHSQQILTLKAVQRRLETHPDQYGEPLRADQNAPLPNFRKLRVKGQRIVYSTFPEGSIDADPVVWIVIVGDREGEAAYEAASDRISKLRGRLHLESAALSELFKQWTETRGHK